MYRAPGRYGTRAVTIALSLLVANPTVAAAADVFVDSGQSLGGLPWHGGVCVGDIDGDGDVDAVVGGHPDSGSDGSNRVWRNDGAGSFSDTGQVLGAGDRTDDCALGDVDGDGDLDVWLSNDTKNTGDGTPDRLWLNNGSGSFSDSGQQIGHERGHGVRLADVDGDGDLDGVVANFTGTFTGDVRVYLNNGSGTFIDSGQILGDGTGRALDVGDLDADGDLDIFFVRGSSQGHLVFLNDGAGTFTDTGQSLGNLITMAVELADLDADGDLDAFVVNSGIGSNGAPNEVWLNDGAGFFTDSGQSVGGLSTSDVSLGDFDKDGDVDALIVSDTSGQPEQVWLNDGAGVFSWAQDVTMNHSRKVAVGDFDGDGDLDAFVTLWGAGNRVYGNITPDSDVDDDGIENEVDGTFDGVSFTDESATPSDRFTNVHLGGTTSGEIVERDGLLVEVKDEVGADGLRFVTSGGSGTAIIEVCGFTASFPAGVEVVITCGSLTADVISGPVEFLLGESPHVIVTIPSSVTATITETSTGVFEISNAIESAGSVSVETEHGVTQVEPGGAAPHSAPICSPVPSTSCKEGASGKSRVQLRIKDGSSDRFKWRFGNGDATAVDDFRDPVQSVPATRICVWDATGKLMEMELPPGGMCAGKSCWKPAGSRGFRYKDRDATPSGVVSVKLRAGSAGKSKIQVKARGGNLLSPVLPLTLPVVVEAVISDGTSDCWQTTFVGATTNDGSQFKASGP